MGIHPEHFFSSHDTGRQVVDVTIEAVERLCDIRNLSTDNAQQQNHRYDTGQAHRGEFQPLPLNASTRLFVQMFNKIECLEDQRYPHCSNPPRICVEIWY
jgi:hypothetical protein